MPFSAVQELLKRELGGDAERSFTWIDPQPFASDAGTQTHRAHFHTGQDVSITVRHSEGERDLVAYGRDAEMLRATHLASPAIHVPLVYWKYTTPRVLVREYQEGTLLEARALREIGYDLRSIARSLFLLFAEAFVGSGWYYRYAHGHPLTVLPGSRIFVHTSDHVGRIPPEVRLVLAELMRAHVRNDLDGVLRGTAEIGGYVSESDLHTMESGVATWFSDHPDVSFGGAFAAIVDFLPRQESLNTLSDVLVGLEQEIIMLYPAFDFTSAYDALSSHAMARPQRSEHFPRYASVS
ncbi:MAG: AarF/UbiB family protein [bacterium]|nr:AarF/UbiB family protein [bacterium]